MKKIKILWGIPASGKSFYAESLKNNKCAVIDFDKISFREKSKQDAIKELAWAVQGKLKRYNEIIIDGLITTNIFAKAIIDKIMKECKDEELQFEIVFWKLDREACLFNDKGRRKINCTDSIMNIPFEEIDKKIIGECSIKLMEVVRKPEYKVWIAENNLGNSDVIESNSWCLGGSRGNCHSNEKCSVSGDPEPSSFDEFDKILEQLCPTITFLQYKRIYSQCVTTETHGEGDYYGGYVEYAKYVCDLKKLHEVLKSYGIIK